MSEKEFYSVKEAARLLGLSRDRIYEHLRRGDLYGIRITEHSAWRIPAEEIGRLKGSAAGKNSVGKAETKAGGWLDYINLALRLQNSLSRIGPKDWAV